NTSNRHRSPRSSMTSVTRQQLARRRTPLSNGSFAMNAAHADHAKRAEHSTHGGNHKIHYARLLLMAALSFMAMFVLMYAMVNTFSNVYLNVNQFYMAGLMTAPMVIIEVALMGMMYRHKSANAAIIV